MPNFTESEIEQLVCDYAAAVDAARAEELNGRDGTIYWIKENEIGQWLAAAGAVITEAYIVTWPTLAAGQQTR
jgi:hypothetical protein